MMQQAETRIAMPRDLRWFLGVLCLLALACAVTEWIGHEIPSLHLNHDPFSTSIAFKTYRFDDFLVFLPKAPFFHSDAFFTTDPDHPFMYPAPTGLVYQLFFLLPGHGLACFLTFTSLAFLVPAFLFGRALHRRLAAFPAFAAPLVVLLLSSPVWFEVRQANMEIVVWAFVTAGVALFLAKRGYSAAACFGFAASMKIYPLAYLGLLWMHRQYRQLAFGIGVAVASTLLSLWLLGGSIGPTWSRITEGLEQFRQIYILPKRFELPWDHSLFALIKLPVHPFPPPQRFAHTLSVYLLVVAIMGLATFFLLARKRPLPNQILFLATSCVLLPPVSFEYTLLHMLVPLACLVLLCVDAARKGIAVPALPWAFACLLITLAPFTEIFVHTHNLNGQIKAVALCALWIISLTMPFTLFRDASAVTGRPLAQGA